MYPLLFIFSFLFSASPQTVNFSITSSCAQAGDFHLAVYPDEESFLAKENLITIIRPVENGMLDVTVTLPAPGKYVVAAYHDLNGNGKLDTNFFGAPAEPYGFATPPPSKWRAPRFAEIVTELRETTATTIELKKWKEY